MRIDHRAFRIVARNSVRDAARRVDEKAPYLLFSQPFKLDAFRIIHESFTDLVRILRGILERVLKRILKRILPPF